SGLGTTERIFSSSVDPPVSRPSISPAASSSDFTPILHPESSAVNGWRFDDRPPSPPLEGAVAPGGRFGSQGVGNRIPVCRVTRKAMGGVLRMRAKIRATRWLYFLLSSWVILQLADVATTYWGLGMPRVVEANPLMATLVHLPVVTIGLKLAV